MKKVLALGMVAVALAIAAAGAAAGTNPNTLTLAVFGDSPYWTLDPALTRPHAEFNATPAFIDTINADPSVQEVIHVGDIHSGSEPCTKPFDQSIFNLWTAFSRPLIYTPGDNEWSDCTKAKELPAGSLRQPAGQCRHHASPCGQPARAPDSGSVDLLREPGLDAGPAPDAGHLAGDRLRPGVSRQTRSTSRTSCGSSRRRSS